MTHEILSPSPFPVSLHFEAFFPAHVERGKKEKKESEIYSGREYHCYPVSNAYVRAYIIMPGRKGDLALRDTRVSLEETSLRTHAVASATSSCT